MGDVEKLARAARRAGFTVEPKPSGRIEWVAPQRGEDQPSILVSSGGKISDPRRLAKIEKFLRENGVDVGRVRPRKKLARARDGERFFLKAEGEPWREVSFDQWVDQERECGFRPVNGTGRATQSFAADGYQGLSTLPSNHESIREIYRDLPA